MDVLRVCAVSIMALLLVNCSLETPDDITPKSTDACVSSSTLVNKYIVKFKNGDIKTIKNNSREDFVKNYVSENFENIDRIEFDEKIKINPLEVSSIKTSSVKGTWGVGSINANEAWRKGYFGEGVVVGVIDTGVDIDHVWLKDRIQQNLGESGIDANGNAKSSNGIDDDGNGFIDDVNGYNFVSKSNDVMDDHGHGTHVSGIIATEHSDTTFIEGKVQGVAPKSTILPIKILGSQGGDISDAILGIRYAVKMGVNLINASWGSDGACSSLLQDTIADLKKDNVLFVTASGNIGKDIDLYPTYPASFHIDSQITVGSISFGQNMAEHSNYGFRTVNVFAPGYFISSSLPGNKYGALSGTSMAAPFVTGLAALILNKTPNMNVMDLKRTLLNSIEYSPGADSYENSNYINSTHGRIDALKYFEGDAL